MVNWQNDWEKRIYNIVVDYKFRHGGNAPSMREIADILCEMAFPISFQQVGVYVKGMVERGVFGRKDGKLLVYGERYEPPEAD